MTRAGFAFMPAAEAKAACRSQRRRGGRLIFIKVVPDRFSYCHRNGISDEISRGQRGARERALP